MEIITENELQLELQDHLRRCERKLEISIKASEDGNNHITSYLPELESQLKQAEMFKSLTLHEELRYALTLALRTNQSFFLTGKPGTGKSIFLDLYRSLSKKKLVIAAPTGVAAINVGGSTLNSIFGLDFSYHGEWYYHNKYADGDRKRHPQIEMSQDRASLLQNMESLAIDEISMTRSDTLDAVSAGLQLIRNNSSLFGGIQLICIGDPFQLPPVADDILKEAYNSEGYFSEFFFHSKHYIALKPKKIEFSKVFRQEEKSFLDVLDKIRFNYADEADLQLLNKNVTEETPLDVISLCTTNKAAKKLNDMNYETLATKEKPLYGSSEGIFPNSMKPVPEMFKVKVDERVLLVKNNWNQGFVNGDIGTLSGWGDHSIAIGKTSKTMFCLEVELDNGKEVIVPPSVWQNNKRVWNKKTKKIDEEEIGTFEQFPILPAWAITIHKSQGKSFDKAYIDFGRGAFAHGQAYVALSRCRTLEGLQLKKPIKNSDIRVDDRVLKYLRGEAEVDVEKHSDDIEALFESLCDMAEAQSENPFKNEEAMYEFLFKVSEKLFTELRLSMEDTNA